MEVTDYVTSPGTGLEGAEKSGAGDDRYVFDEAAGWACVIDGATDVGPVRIFSQGDTDAARFAEIFAAALLLTTPQPTETPQQFFTRFLPRLRLDVEREVRIALKDAPLASYPTAAAIWLRASHGSIETASLGDSIAIIRDPSGRVTVMGEPGKPGEEQTRAKRVMVMRPDERRKWLQDVRAIHNTQRGYWVFGVQPEAAAHILHQTAAAPPGTRILAMTDGFYRLVSPYGRYTDAALIEAAIAKGLGPLLTELRSLEASPADDEKIGRFKTSDDATALLLEV
jgi:Protein phosphatase 2C